MKSLLQGIYLIAITGLMVSCASSDAPTDNAHPYADISEGFMTQEPRTYREENEATPFFFKQCEQRFSKSFYSKTSYFCNER